jgi:hypothetical protein
MRTLNEIFEVLYRESDPGGKHLLCLSLRIPLSLYQEHLRSKMNEIAKRHDPALIEDNPFTRMILDKVEVWTDPYWRDLRKKRSLVEYISFVPFLTGVYFGFQSVILILGNIFNW